jgi:hypothetical protein
LAISLLQMGPVYRASPPFSDGTAFPERKSADLVLTGKPSQPIKKPPEGGLRGLNGNKHQVLAWATG